MTPIPFVIAAGILALIGVIIVVWAERTEEKERQKLQNYRKAEIIGFYRSRRTGIIERPRWV